MLPFLALFFPVEVAIIYTAVIHLLNNIFKVFLFRHSVAIKRALLFGLPAIIGSAVGALILSKIAHWDIAFTGQLWGVSFLINPIKVVIGSLLLFIGLNELFPLFHVNVTSRGAFTVGGFVSGFFGGLAGLQGAFRSYILVKSSDDKDAFLGTSAAIALMVDVTRVIFYSKMIALTEGLSFYGYLVITAALIGVLVGKKLLPKIELAAIHQFIAVLLITFGGIFCLGII